MNLRTYLLVGLSLLLYNCNLLNKKNDSVVVKGTVLNSSSNNSPISGLSVILQVPAGSWDHPTVAKSETNNSGQFYLEYELDDIDIARVYVNDDPYDPAYSVFQFGVKKGDTIERTIELQEN
jgi:hypothetical protein